MSYRSSAAFARPSAVGGDMLASFYWAQAQQYKSKATPCGCW